jgi:hypothetical protein
MIEITITVEGKVFDDILAKLPLTKQTAERAFRQVIAAARPRIEGKMQAPSNVPDLPFVWSYDPAANARARRWYFANKVPKGSKGGRYQRTGALTDGLDVALFSETDGFSAAITSAFDKFEYVIGDRQVPSHEQTPWFNLDAIVDEESILLADEVIDRWLELVDLTGGVV